MLRRDFISKIIEQMVNAVARLLKTDYEKETEKFLDEFDTLLDTYYRLSDEELELLLEADEERDAMLLDEKLKNLQLQLFIQAGQAFLKKEERRKAENCLKIIERIQLKHSDVYEFPTPESLKTGDEIGKLKKSLAN